MEYNASFGILILWNDFSQVRKAILQAISKQASLPEEVLDEVKKGLTDMNW